MKFKFKKYQLIAYGAALLLGLVISIGIFNYRQDQLIKLDVTWIDAHQAIIFWKTPEIAKGYVKYGQQRLKLSQKAEQTNNQASVLHVVVLDNLPTGEIFVTLHSDQDSLVRMPKAISINYETQQNEPN